MGRVRRAGGRRARLAAGADRREARADAARDRGRTGSTDVQIMTAVTAPAPPRKPTRPSSPISMRVWPSPTSARLPRSRHRHRHRHAQRSRAGRPAALLRSDWASARSPPPSCWRIGQRAVAALAGLAAYDNDSGTFRDRRFGHWRSHPHPAAPPRGSPRRRPVRYRPWPPPPPPAPRRKNSRRSPSSPSHGNCLSPSTPYCAPSSISPRNDELHRCRIRSRTTLRSASERCVAPRQRAQLRHRRRVRRRRVDPAHECTDPLGHLLRVMRMDVA